jgi:hypothetical protein
MLQTAVDPELGRRFATGSGSAGKRDCDARLGKKRGASDRGHVVGFSVPSEGGCQCGEIRYRITGQPVWLAVCHCNEC